MYIAINIVKFIHDISLLWIDFNRFLLYLQILKSIVVYLNIILKIITHSNYLEKKL